MELRGRWALVTGAAERVGRVVAHELAGRGTNVVVHFHTSAAEADAAVASLQAIGVQALAPPGRPRGCDSGAPPGCRCRDADGRHRAPRQQRVQLPADAVRRHHRSRLDASLDVNLKAPFLLAWTLGRAMRTRGEGVIVNIADWAGERPYRHYLPYCISKAGLIALTKSLAKELAPAVRVNAVAPGPVLLPEDFGPEQVAAIRRATPLGRIGSPEDVARAIRFLAEEADFSTGSILHVDGGRGIA